MLQCSIFGLCVCISVFVSESDVLQCCAVCIVWMSELKVVSQQKEAEMSELKVKIDELKVTAGHEAKSREEMQLHYQQRLREKQTQLEHYRRLDAADF